jgi:hypothetical protein
MRRWLGILPLTFFIAHLSTNLKDGTPENMLWLCNLSNLVLALGIFFRLPLLIRISALWLIPGIPLWLVDMTRTGYSPASTFVSHVGGLAVAIYALSKIHATKTMWLYGWIYGFLVQAACRLFTPPVLNVNVAFETYPPLSTIFHHYWQYWIFNAVASAAGLWLIAFVLNVRLSGAEFDDQIA